MAKCKHKTKNLNQNRLKILTIQQTNCNKNLLIALLNTQRALFFSKAIIAYRDNFDDFDLY